MTVSVETLIDRSVRNMGDVHPLVEKKTKEVIRQAYNEGIYVQISSGFRSFDEQAELYAQGRTTGGNVVTNAEPGESVHNYGFAVDYFLTSDYGNKALWSVNDDWCRVAEIAKSLGFEWGGDWTSFKDYPHLQLTEGLTWQDLQAGRRPSFCDDGNVEPVSDNNNLLENGDQSSDVKVFQGSLEKLGYELGPVDGIYGPKTEAAVKRFQGDHDLAVDGIIGPNTKAAIHEALNKTEYPLPDGVWNTDDNGYHKEVEQIQRALCAVYFYPNKGAKNNGVDGYYGPNTQDAVRRFQSVYIPHEIDGVYGPTTRKHLKQVLKEKGKM
ncbi:peptidoglycan-binding protein [Tuberibacillus sp. Marseille-P3662]|uniref:peptidoglycan-binding protein n=1 Tax=Tuberibacillus sp. Marseille-P3662 TaxID=1965358 RepID=UPI000A1CA78F|nr:peptidoglycan-binding protein [Tuberibacillus sp. Marseille-P3662]